jgi:hypothetical protein
MLLPDNDANLAIGNHPQGGSPVVTANVNARAAGYTPVWEVTNADQANALAIVVTVSWADQYGTHQFNLINVKPG